SLGIRRQRLRFNQRVATANGVILAASVTLDRVRIGQLVYYDVEAMVIDAPLNISLLGMSFLTRLDGFEVAGNRLILRW
ncbi:MAG: TIGR02281 family clan AA aspartic protease, partial [Alphaproteobacteria bacterium]